MPKRKKTRKQKVIADTRHKEYTILPDTAREERSPSQSILKSHTPAKQTITVSEYSYLYSDLKKTLILTFSIVVAQLVIKYYIGV